MPLFTSSREKRLWLWAFVVFAAILSTLFIGKPLASLLSDQNVQAVFFVAGMILVGAAIAVHMFRTKPGKTEIAVVFGIVAVYMMFFLRLGLPERSHLIEYSVLAIFIHKAFRERINHSAANYSPALFAFTLTFLIGVLDECIQIVLPDRVFDPLDIVFNGMAITMAIGSSVAYAWVRKWTGKSNLKR